jgi:hypothetical protein
MRQLLVSAALVALFGVSVSLSASAVNAAPAGSAAEALKASAREGTAVQQVMHRRGHRYHRYHHRRCWWGDRWLCSRLW